jgi:predicted PurR-regulated permease PerM
VEEKMNWRHWVALWKFRLDNSISFLVVVNFILLSITASKPIMEFMSDRFNLHTQMYSIVGFLVLIIVICAFLFGYILDKFMRYTQHTMSIQNSRNPELTEILHNTRQLLIRKPTRRQK